MHFKVRRGLDIPLAGEPEQIIDHGPGVGSVALLATDYVGASFTARVREGERVSLGQALFEDRHNPEVRFASPGAGVVSAIHGGTRDELASIVVTLSGNEEERFSTYASGELAGLDRQRVAETLCSAGLWTAFRTRPFGKVPRPTDAPRAIFVTAIDTNPLAPAPHVIMDAHRTSFADGLRVISRLTEGRVYVCTESDAVIPPVDSDKITVACYSGPHPAGLVGTHIALLAPVGAGRNVWHLGYQDVIAIGKLFTSGRLWIERIISLGGSMVRRPRLLRTRLGANTSDLTRGELTNGDCRIISGSVLSGRTASEPADYLGRYHLQLSVLAEQRASEPGHEVGHKPYTFYGPPWPNKRPSALTTSVHGRTRAMVPFSSFDRVMPLDILVSPLLRALLVGDADTAEALGCLELEEEDLALCTFLCPSKNEYGRLLRSVLTEIDARGSS